MERASDILVRVAPGESMENRGVTYEHANTLLHQPQLGIYTQKSWLRHTKGKVSTLSIK